MKMHRRLINTLLLIAPMLALGCATLVVGDKQSLTFDSQPAGAQIIMNGTAMGVTPATITIKKSDYQNATVIFKRGLHGSVRHPPYENFRVVLGEHHLLWPLGVHH